MQTVTGQLFLTFRLDIKYNVNTKFMTWNFQGVDMLLLTTQLGRCVHRWKF